MDPGGLHMYIYNNIICIILLLHQITKKMFYANARVFLMQRLMVHLTSFALLTAVISLSQFFYFIESRENTIV